MSVSTASCSKWKITCGVCPLTMVKDERRTSMGGVVVRSLRADVRLENAEQTPHLAAWQRGERTGGIPRVRGARWRT